MAHNTHHWGRHKARERYAEGGDVPPVRIIPAGVSGLSKRAAAAWASKTRPGTMNNISGPSIARPMTGETFPSEGGSGPHLNEERKRGGRVK